MKHTQIKFGLNALTAAILMAAPLTNAYADDVETVVVTANRMEQDINDVLANIEVIERAEIDALQVTTVADLLDKLAGVEVVRQGGIGNQTSIFTRGTSSDHTLILIDGARVGSATLGNKTIQTIPLVQVERVEIIRGPRAALWGSDAIGGVIHIITRRMQANEFSAGVKIGSDEYWKANAAAGFGSSQHNVTLAASREVAEGFSAITGESEPDNDGHAMTSFLARGEFNFSEQFSLSVLGQLEKGYAAFDSTWLNEGKYYNRVFDITAGLSLGDWSNTVSLNTSADENWNYGRLAETVWQPYEEVPEGSEKQETYETKRDQFNWLTHYELTEGFDVSGGVDYYQEDVSGSTTSFQVNEREVTAGFVRAGYAGELLLAEIAVRHDDFNDKGNDTFDGKKNELTYSGSLGFRWSDAVRTSINYATSFKAPTFNDLYWPGSENDSLVSETGKNLEINSRVNSGPVLVDFTVFQSDIDNLIEWAPNPTEENPWRWTPSNVRNVEIFGGELKVKLDAGSSQHEIQLHHVDSEDQDPERKTQMARRARQKASYQIGFDIGDFNITGQYQFNGKRIDRVSQTVYHLGGYSIVNLALSFTITDSWIVRFKAYNLFDKDYQQVVSYNTPGDKYYLGVEYRNF